MARTIILILAFSTITLMSYSQSIQIGLTGYQKFGYQKVCNVQGSELAKSKEGFYFSYGFIATYQPKKNGVEFDLTAYPYRVNLISSTLLGGISNPSYLTLSSFFYRRELFYYKKRKAKIYGLLGLGISKYKRIPLGIEVDYSKDGSGNIISQGSIDDISNYNSSIVIFPQLRLELEKRLFSSVFISLYGQFTYKNIASSKALEMGEYQISYYNNSGSGNIANYGAGYLIGLQLKYGFK